MKRISLLLAIGITACTKIPDPVAVTPASLSVQISHEVDGKPLAFSTMYKNAHGDDYEIYSYKYYISNISLIKDGGSEFKEVESYHLINESMPTTKTIDIAGINTGSYVKIKFLLGVDSLRNVNGAQAGDLAADKGMFWTWNSGYIMAAIEGYSPQASSYPENLGFHVGGFSGRYSALRWVTLQLPATAVVADGKKTTVYLNGNIAEWFKTPSTIDFALLQTITSGGEEASAIADNYQDMFYVSKVETK
jgi:hypothetical protein